VPSELDRSTRLVSTGDLTFDTEVSDAWGISGIPNGGYLLALGATALGQVLSHPDPLTVTAHFARPSRPGPGQIVCEVIKAGRTQSMGVARLLQDGKERFRVTGTFTDLSALRGPSNEAPGKPPPIPPIERCQAAVAAPPGSTFGDRVELRFVPGTTHFATGERGDMVLGGWIRLADGREPDPLSLLLLADAWPPPALNGVDERVWVPTLELTVHVRRRPSPGWVRAWFRTRYLIDGTLEEDGELWDARGNLVALSRQMARVSTA
jgi:acyl-CoA thioesterase